MNSSSRRTYSSPIRTICVPQTGQIWSSSSGRGITTFSTFRPLKRSSWGCLLFTGMFLDHSFFLPAGTDPVPFLLHQRDSVVPNIIRSSFAGRAEKFFGKIVHLFLERFLVTGFFVNNRRRDLISSVCSDTIVFSCDTVSFSSLSWISFALESIVFSLLGFDTFIIPETALLLKENGSRKMPNLQGIFGFFCAGFLLESR